MALRARRQHGNGLDAWPGYVDALSTLLMVIIFVLLVFVLAQAFLSVTLYGRNQALEKATKQLSEISDALAVERGKTFNLRVSVAQLGKELASGTAERDRLTQQIAEANLALQAAGVASTKLRTQLSDAASKAAAASQDAAAAKARLAEMQQQIAELDRTVSADKETLQARLSDLATLAQQVRALTALRDELQKQVEDYAAKATNEQQKRQAVEAQLGDEKKQSDTVRAQVSLLNQQIDQLKLQLAAIASSLNLTQQQNEEKDTQ